MTAKLRLLQLSLALSGLALAGMVLSLWQMRETGRDNELIEHFLADRGGIVDPAESEPAVLLARAIYLARRERDEDAIAQLKALTNRGNDPFRAMVHYNLGNLHLRDALRRTESSQFDEAATAAELAKQNYRAALTLNPAFWDAKYNLETASRLLPDMDRIDRAQDGPPDEQQPKRLWTTLPGFPRGLP